MFMYDTCLLVFLHIIIISRIPMYGGSKAHIPNVTETFPKKYWIVFPICATVQIYGF
jgi:hypothetical protein